MASSQQQHRRPVGREQVVAAVVEHAADLFAEQGPAATSMRDIAARSGVNLGLIHRHFGSKQQLVGAVLDRLGDDAAALSASDADRSDIDARADRDIRVAARVILDGYPLGELKARFPVISAVLEDAIEQHGDTEDVRMAVANMVALELGWRLFGPFIRSATGLTQVPDTRLRAAVHMATARLLEQPSQ
ncbi:helix-turn-helix domain-containing protein [Nocardia sp. NPDC052112]|uniref:TetR/AcrR family transcriptional regulator n=1 Tax=Nocardia sp. NPDC052112 TaxID=3155646 RepID=UPI003437D925